MSDARPFRLRKDGVELLVRLTPRAARDGIDGAKLGPDGAYVQARVRAVPEDGRANEALVELVAEELDLPKAAITLVLGHTSRMKTLHIAGNVTDLAARLAAWLKEAE